MSQIDAFVKHAAPEYVEKKVFEAKVTELKKDIADLVILIHQLATVQNKPEVVPAPVIEEVKAIPETKEEAIVAVETEDMPEAEYKNHKRKK